MAASSLSGPDPVIVLVSSLGLLVLLGLGNVFYITRIANRQPLTASSFPPPLSNGLCAATLQTWRKELGRGRTGVDPHLELGED